MATRQIEVAADPMVVEVAAVEVVEEEEKKLSRRVTATRVEFLTFFFTPFCVNG